MAWCKKLTHPILATALITAVTLLPTVTTASCIECHNDVYLNAQKLRYVHQPVSNKQCTACHTGELSETQQTNQQEPPPDSVIAEFNQQQRITWLAETFATADKHFALLKQDLSENDITVEVWSQQREKLQFSLRVPPLSEMRDISPYQQVQILHPHLLDNDLMPLSHVNVTWQTSEPCRCSITYTSSDHQYSVEEDDLYTLEHSIVLHNCRKEDVVQIECTDPFGQQLSPPPKTVADFPRIVRSEQSATEKALTQQQIGFSFNTLAQSIWLELKAPVKFSVSIGTTEEQKGVNKKQRQAAVALSTPVPEVPAAALSHNQQPATEHDNLLSAREINLSICYRCHQNMLGWTSHPVDITAPPGMIIPPEYPLLADGRISCMTCHTVHSSNLEYRLIKDSKRALCIGCHTNY